MQKSYLNNYIQTYIWQGLSIVFNLTSMFIVIPFISENKVIFGIYSVCISTSIFLNYADIGFVSAAIKYAGESYARGEHEDELRYYGLSGFILFIFISVISIIYLLLAFNPSFLISDINSSDYLNIASLLLIIQAVFSYNNVLQRYVTSVFQVRIEQFIYQRVNMAANLLKIISVFYFFQGESYRIVPYYIFIKSVELLAIIVSIIIIKIRYNISFLGFLKAFRFDKDIYIKTKDLAYSSLFITVMWIAFYEIDIIVIGHYYGADLVAIYALSFTLTKFLRSITSMLYSPFKSRYNHFVGLNQHDRLSDLLKRVIQLTMPLMILTLLSVIVLSSNIVTTWAGMDYYSAGIILALLAASYIFSSIRIPGANLMVALEKIKEMYLINASMVAIFWSGIILTQQFWGINSFAASKLVASMFATGFYLRILLKYFNIGFWQFLESTILRMVIPMVVQVLFLLYIAKFLPQEKSMEGFTFVVISGGGSTLVGLFTLYLSSQYYRELTNKYVSKVRIRI